MAKEQWKNGEKKLVYGMYDIDAHVMDPNSVGPTPKIIRLEKLHWIKQVQSIA